MRIAVVNQPMDTLLPPHQNSIGIWTYKTMPFVARDHDVLVIGKRSDAQRSWDGGDGVRYAFIPPVVPNRRLMTVLDALAERRTGDHLPAYASPLAYLDYAVQAAWAARRFDADVVHIHNFSQFVPTVRRLCPGAKIVLHMACEWLDQLDREVIDRRLEQVDVVVGCSDHITAQVVARFPHHAPRCRTVYNGVDIERFDATATPATAGGDGSSDGSDRIEDSGGASTLLFVGRVSPEKGLHDLIEAFVQVADQCPGVRLDIAGPIVSLPREFIVDVTDDPEIAALGRFYDRDDGADYADVLLQRVPEHLLDRVRLLGAMPQDDLAQRYAAAAIVVNPSYSESFGMSLVESMACSTPFVATRVGGMVDVAGEDGSVGLLVERGSPTALAAAVGQLLRDDDLRAEMGRRGRARVLDVFSWQRVAAALGATYRGLDVDA